MNRYTLTILSVDATTTFQLHTQDKSLLLPFLRRYDHEGSVVTLDHEAQDEDVYKVLEERT